MDKYVPFVTSDSLEFVNTIFLSFAIVVFMVAPITGMEEVVGAVGRTGVTGVVTVERGGGGGVRGIRGWSKVKS